MMMWIESYATVLHTAHCCKEKSMNRAELEHESSLLIGRGSFRTEWTSFFKRNANLVVGTI